MKLVASLVLFGALAFPAVSSADAPVAWQHKAVALSEHVFSPTCGPLTVAFEDPTQSHAGLPDHPDGQAAPAVERPAGWALKDVCIVHVDMTKVWLGYPEFCRVVLHEAGNVVGYSDDWGNPHSIRYPDPLVTKTIARVGGRTVTRWSGVDRRCLPASR